MVLAEILGPAGAGKSTLLAAIAQHHPASSPIGGYRSPRLAPAYARAAAVRAPLLWTASRTTTSPTKLINWMIRLECSERVIQLQRPVPGEERVVLFDQGPAYTLMRLLPEGGIAGTARCEAFDRWWQRMLCQWAQLLDVVIVVDAADDVLLERVLTRPKWHAAKGLAPQRARQLIGDYRTRCETVVDALSVDGGPEIVRIDTSSYTLLESLATSLLALRIDPARNRA